MAALMTFQKILWLFEKSIWIFEKSWWLFEKSNWFLGKANLQTPNLFHSHLYESFTQHCPSPSTLIIIYINTQNVLAPSTMAFTNTRTLAFLHEHCLELAQLVVHLHWTEILDAVEIQVSMILWILEKVFFMTAKSSSFLFWE
jgi:hypothetical protein